MARPERRDNRRHVGHRSRATLALAQVALDAQTVDAALRTLHLQQDSEVAGLVREIGPSLAAPELVRALNDSVRSQSRSEEVYDGLRERLEAKKFRTETVSERRSAEAVSPGIGSAWIALGKKIGFLPVYDDLAVIVHEPPYPGSPEKVVDRVASVAALLDRAGHAHAAIALASTGLPDDVETAIFEAGAQLLVVEPGFMDLSDAEQITKLQNLLDNDLYEPLADRPANGLDEGLYDEPNPFLSPGELSDWERRFEQSNEAD